MSAGHHHRSPASPSGLVSREQIGAWPRCRTGTTSRRSAGRCRPRSRRSSARESPAPNHSVRYSPTDHTDQWPASGSTVREDRGTVATRPERLADRPVAVDHTREATVREATVGSDQLGGATTGEGARSEGTRWSSRSSSRISPVSSSRGRGHLDREGAHWYSSHHATCLDARIARRSAVATGRRSRTMRRGCPHRCGRGLVPGLLPTGQRRRRRAAGAHSHQLVDEREHLGVGLVANRIEALGHRCREVLRTVGLGLGRGRLDREPGQEASPSAPSPGSPLRYALRALALDPT